MSPGHQDDHPDPTQRHLAILDDLVEACEVAAQTVSGGRGRYLEDRQSQFASEAILTRIGEGLARLPDEILDRQPDIPRAAIRGMRNRTVHEYHRIDYVLVWQTLSDFLPALREQLLRLRSGLR